MDIFLAVVISAITFAIAFMGVRVTLHPVKEGNAKKYTVGFVLLSLFACLLVGWQAYLGHKSQGEVQSLLKSIQHNTETPQKIAPIFNVPPSQVIIQPQSVQSIRSSNVRVEIMHGDKALDGSKISYSSDSPKVLYIPEFQAKNYGNRATQPISVRLYLSKSTSSNSGLWVATTSEDTQFPVEFFVSGSAINPQETWNLPDFTGEVSGNWEDNEEIKGKLKIFYGSSKPATALFSITKTPK